MLSARRAAVWAPGWCKPLGEAGTPEILFPERPRTLLGDSALPNPVGCSLRDRARGRGCRRLGAGRGGPPRSGGWVARFRFHPRWAEPRAENRVGSEFPVGERPQLRGTWRLWAAEWNWTPMRCEDRQRGPVRARGAWEGCGDPRGPGWQGGRAGCPSRRGASRGAGQRNREPARAFLDPLGILQGRSEPGCRLPWKFRGVSAGRAAQGCLITPGPRAGASVPRLTPEAGKRPFWSRTGGLACLGYRSDPPRPRATPGSERSRAGAPDLLIRALPSALRGGGERALKS